MNETWIITIFTAIVLILIAGVSGALAFMIQMSGRVSRLEGSHEFLKDAMGRLAAKKLHSPDDHLGMDELLDEYINHSHDMTMQQWQMLKNKCLESRVRETATKEEKAYAEFLIELCEHKMTPRSGARLYQEDTSI